MHEDWIDVVPALDESVDSITAQRLRIWSLVLSSQFIDHRVSGARGQWELFVRSDDAERAVHQIRSYESENSEWASSWLPAKTFSAARASFTVLALVALVHFVTAFGAVYSRSVWMSVGSADAGLILRGQWWRVATALTLHADVLHLMGNVVIGGFFILWLCREVGAGLGWLLVLTSGVLGNTMNALVQSPLHNSIGASTAVFGAIGILSGLRVHETGPASRSVIIPLMTGIVLLALLGTGGERTDVGAHLFGLIAGAGLGALLSTWLTSHALPDPATQRVLGITAVILPIAAWAWGLAVVL